MDLIHAEDERIPVDSLEFGTTAMLRLLERPDLGSRRLDRHGGLDGRS
jgi:hypothetical protein